MEGSSNSFIHWANRRLCCLVNLSYVSVIDVKRTEGARLHWFVRVIKRERSEHVRDRAWYWQYNAMAYVLAVSKLYFGSLL